MEVPGVCSSCGGIARPAYTCSACGSIVCSKCFDADIGLCNRCTAQTRKGF